MRIVAVYWCEIFYKILDEIIQLSLCLVTLNTEFCIKHKKKRQSALYFTRYAEDIQLTFITGNKLLPSSQTLSNEKVQP